MLGGQRKFYFIERLRKERTLPTVLSEEQVRRLLMAVDNLKHRALLMVAYSAGLRVREVIALRPTDIDRDRRVINVGNGKKDRVTLLSEKTLGTLGEYIAL